jgi:hypothetical protein
MSFLENIPTSEKSSVQVAVRVRPLNDREKNSDTITTVIDHNIQLLNPDDKKKKSFSYDYLYDTNTPQEKVYDEVGKQIIDSAYKGYNGCIFAYGQTGCFAPGTSIKLIDNTYKNVEDITKEDVIMGDDCTPRHVQQLFHGVQTMYKVTSNNGTYTVNRDHILVLAVDPTISCTWSEGLGVICQIDTSKIPLQTIEHKFDDFRYYHSECVCISRKLHIVEMSITDYLDSPYKDHFYLISQTHIPQFVWTNYPRIEIHRSEHGYLEYLPYKGLSSYFRVAEFTVEELSPGPYYGFMLDGNHRFIGAGNQVLRNSGKSHTMMGETSIHITPNSGLIPRICQALFDAQATHNNIPKGNCEIIYKVEFSYLEIYSEEVRDLMRKDNPAGGLKVRQHPEYGPYVEGLTQILVEDVRTIKKLIEQGNKERSIASTLMNQQSSRSHAILTLYFTQVIHEPALDKTREIVSRINLVDLAGSERVEASGVSGINFKEAININKSLSTLGCVIRKLAEKPKPTSKQVVKKPVIKKKPIAGKTRISSSGLPGAFGVYETTSEASSNSKIFVSTAPIQDHIPFRDSVLTWILKESLGGNSKTYMIATVSPSALNYNETLNTLRYASNAKHIVNTIKVNEDQNDRIIKMLKDEIQILKDQLKHSANSADGKEISEQIAEREELRKQREKSWEQKYEESRQTHVAIQEQYKQELAIKQAEFMKKIEEQNTEYKSLMDEMEQMRYVLNEKEVLQQHTIESEILKTREEYERKQDEFEKGKMFETATNLNEYYEKKIETIKAQYDEKIKEIEQKYHTDLINEIDEWKSKNEQLEKELTSVKKELDVESAKFRHDRSIFSKQIQQLKLKINSLENSDNLENKYKNLLLEIEKQNEILDNLKAETMELSIRLESERTVISR